MSKPGSSASISKSYEHLRREIGDQYDYMTRPKEHGGMGLRHEVVAEDPYRSAAEMANDVRSGRIRTLASQTTNEPGSATGTSHQALSDEDNDRFRAVHDVFGHAAVGRGFSRHGEEAAYRSHIQMFSPEARQAATSELRGQNSYLNYSPEGGFPDVGGRMIPMPRWTQATKGRQYGAGQAGKLFRDAAEQMRFEF